MVSSHSLVSLSACDLIFLLMTLHANSPSPCNATSPLKDAAAPLYPKPEARIMGTCRGPTEQGRRPLTHSQSLAGSGSQDEATLDGHPPPRTKMNPSQCRAGQVGRWSCPLGSSKAKWPQPLHGHRVGDVFFLMGPFMRAECTFSPT